MLVRSWTVETVGERLRRRLSGSTRAESHDRHGRALDQSPAIFAALRRRLVGHRSVAAHRTASSHQPRRPCLGGATDGCPLAPSLRFRHLVSFDLPVGAWCCRSIGRSVHGGHGSPWAMSGSPTNGVVAVADACPVVIPEATHRVIPPAARCYTTPFGVLGDVCCVYIPALPRRLSRKWRETCERRGWVREQRDPTKRFVMHW